MIKLAEFKASARNGMNKSFYKKAISLFNKKNVPLEATIVIEGNICDLSIKATAVTVPHPGKYASHVEWYSFKEFIDKGKTIKK